MSSQLLSLHSVRTAISYCCCLYESCAKCVSLAADVVVTKHITVIDLITQLLCSLPTALVVQIEQLVGCVCVCVCPDNKFCIR